MYFSSVKLLHHMVVWLQQRWKWCLKFAGREHSTRRICFYWLSCMLLVWHKLLIWEKAITKKRIAILIKETKIKTLEPGNKSLVRSIIFLSSEKARTQKKKKKDGRDLITTWTLMTADTPNTRSFGSRDWRILAGKKHAKKRTFIHENAYFISY